MSDSADGTSVSVFGGKLVVGELVEDFVAPTEPYRMIAGRDDFRR